MQDFVICSTNVSCTSNFDLIYVVKMSDVIIWDFVMNVTKYLSLRGEQTEFARLKIPSVNRALIAPFELYETARKDREREREREKNGNRFVVKPPISDVLLFSTFFLV